MTNCIEIRAGEGDEDTRIFVAELAIAYLKHDCKQRLNEVGSFEFPVGQAA
jgi:hypothetical protein